PVGARIERSALIGNTAGRQERAVGQTVAERVGIGTPEVGDQPVVTTKLQRMGSSRPGEVVRNVVNRDDDTGGSRARQRRIQSAQPQKRIRRRAVLPYALANIPVVNLVHLVRADDPRIAAKHTLGIVRVHFLGWLSREPLA